MDHINRFGGGPLDHHRAFKAAFGLQKGDWGVGGHNTVLRLLEEAGNYDGLDMPNIAALEVVVRHAQLIEYVYAQDQKQIGKKGKGGGTESAGIVGEASVFAGTHRETGEVMICPTLLDYVAKEVERDASVMKQVHKAREERRLATRGGGAAARRNERCLTRGSPTRAEIFGGRWSWSTSV